MAAALLILLASAEPAPAPPPPKILVMRWSVASGAQLTRSDLLDDLLTASVADAQPHAEVVGMRDVEALLNLEQAKDLIGCDDVTCTAEVGLALAADLLIQGSLGRIGDRTFAVLKVIDARNATVAARVDGSTGGADVTSLIEKLVLEVFGIDRPQVYTTLPGSSFEQWLTRMQDLAYTPLRCGDTDECLRIALARIEAIEFLLSKDDWPPELEEHRDALVARLESLYRHADRLRAALRPPPDPTPVATQSSSRTVPVVIWNQRERDWRQEPRPVRAPGPQPPSRARRTTVESPKREDRTTTFSTPRVVPRVGPRVAPRTKSASSGTTMRPTYDTKRVRRSSSSKPKARSSGSPSKPTVTKAKKPTSAKTRSAKKKAVTKRTTGGSAKRRH